MPESRMVGMNPGTLLTRPRFSMGLQQERLPIPYGFNASGHSGGIHPPYLPPNTGYSNSRLSDRIPAEDQWHK